LATNYKEVEMNTNVGSADRVIRIVLGLALAIAAFVPGLGLAGTPLLQWGAALIGLVLIATAVVRFCPLYRILGFSTCKVRIND
jgi:membrane protein YdbS with pleckstrin-like domain